MPMPKQLSEHEPHQSRPLTPLVECVVGALAPRDHPCISDITWLEGIDTTDFDFEETFLAHAKVYALAHYKSIDALKALAQERLSRILLKLHPMGPNPHLAINIVNLATYVYSNTDSLSNSEEPLRNIISQFVALNFAAWQRDSRSLEMMCSGGDFVRDVLSKLCRRLGDGTRERLAPPGTRFISRFRVGSQRFCTPQ